MVNLPPSGQLFSSSDSARKDLVSYSPPGHEESDVTERLPLRGVKGVKPPMEFGEMTRDCFPGHAGKKALISR